MLELYDQIQSATSAIREKWDHTPRAGIILGTGLGGFADRIESPVAIDYEQTSLAPRQ
jgi:purine-nucleoside phosphorylase